MAGLAESRILVGAGVLSISPYVTAGGSGTFVDWGHTLTPLELTPALTNFDVKGERSPGILKSVPIDQDFTIQVDFAQGELDLWAIALRQPGANLTPNPIVSPFTGTLLVGDATEIYQQIKIVGPGPGSVLTRTLLFWRAQIMSLAKIPFAKAGVQNLQLTFRVNRDSTLATADKFFKVVDT